MHVSDYEHVAYDVNANTQTINKMTYALIDFEYIQTLRNLNIVNKVHFTPNVEVFDKASRTIQILPELKYLEFFFFF